MAAETRWTTDAQTLVEVRRNVARLLETPALADARDAFARHWRRIDVVELDEETRGLGAELAEMTRARTLDALHLAAASRAGGARLTFVTFDVRLAQAARALGWTVVGA